jgi:hypothetical protein
VILLATITEFSLKIGEAIQACKDVLPLFVKEPTIYFTAIAFVGAALGVSRKLIPMKKR